MKGSVQQKPVLLQEEYEQYEQEQFEQDQAELEIETKMQAVQLPDVPDPEVEKLHRTRKAVARVDDFIASLPALGTW